MNDQLTWKDTWRIVLIVALILFAFAAVQAQVGGTKPDINELSTFVPDPVTPAKSDCLCPALSLQYTWRVQLENDNGEWETTGKAMFLPSGSWVAIGLDGQATDYGEIVDDLTHGTFANPVRCGECLTLQNLRGVKIRLCCRGGIWKFTMPDGRWGRLAP